MTETITTAATEQRTFVLDTYVLVDDSTVLCTRSTNAKAISLLNAGVGATFTAVAVNVDMDDDIDIDAGEKLCAYYESIVNA